MLNRILAAFSIALLSCAALQAADEPADKPSIAGQVAEIQKSVAEASRQMLAARQKYTASRNESKKELLELIEANPDDPGIIEAVTLLVDQSLAPLDDKLIAKVSKGLLKSPKAADFCLRLASPRPLMKGQADLLRQVAEEHEDAEVRGVATFALGNFHLLTARKAKVQEKDEHLKEAEKCFTKVTTDYENIASRKFGRTTIGEKTVSNLRRLESIPNLQIGKVAPEIEGVDMDGNPLKLSDSRGKVTVLIFWGSWCGPCMAMVPHEKELYERMQGKPFRLISVNCGDPLERAQATRKDKGMEWPCFWDGGTTDGPIQATYDVPHWPRIFVLDAQGVIRNIDVREKQLDEAVDKLVEEIEGKKMVSR